MSVRTPTPESVERLRRRALGLAGLTIAWNVVEAVVAVVAGIAAGSIALVGFGFDSTVEVLSAWVVVWQFRAELSGGYDEGRERRALRLIGVTFFVLAAYVTVEAVRDLFLVDAEADESVVGITLASLSLLVMPVLALAKRRTADQLGSPTLRADATETLLCAWLSVVCGPPHVEVSALGVVGLACRGAGGGRQSLTDDELRRVGIEHWMEELIELGGIDAENGLLLGHQTFRRHVDGDLQSCLHAPLAGPAFAIHGSGAQSNALRPCALPATSAESLPAIRRKYGRSCLPGARAPGGIGLCRRGSISVGVSRAWPAPTKEYWHGTSRRMGEGDGGVRGRA